MISWNTLQDIDWPATAPTADWVKALDELLALAADADTPSKCSALAEALDQFADSSNSDDLATLISLDKAARKAARGLRLADMAQRIQALEAASSDYRAAVKALNAATSGLQEEARLLRAQQVRAAVTSLSGTILALNRLSESVTAQDDAQLREAIDQAARSMKKLRSLLEVPA